MKLNIGGEVFKTLRSMLLRVPGSLLYDIASGSTGKELLHTEDGAIFIDRSPALFERVLDYLRTGDLYASGCTATRDDRRMMLTEAEYYRIPNLVWALRGAEVPSVLGLTTDHTRAFTEWCGVKKGERFVLL